MREIPLIALLAVSGVDCATPPTKVQAAATPAPEEIDSIEFYRNLATLQRKSMKKVYDHIEERHKMRNVYVCAALSVYKTPHGKLFVVAAGDLMNITQDETGKLDIS